MADPNNDRLDGAAAVAAYLGWPIAKVYRAREKAWSTPIRRQDGLGVYAFKSELDAWMRAAESLPQRAAS